MGDIADASSKRLAQRGSSLDIQIRGWLGTTLHQRIAAVRPRGDVLSNGAHGWLHCYAGQLVLSTLKSTVSTPLK